MAERRSRMAMALVAGALLLSGLLPLSAGHAAPGCTGDITTGTQLASAVEDGRAEVELDPHCTYRLPATLVIGAGGAQVTIEGNGATLVGGADPLFVVDQSAALALDAVNLAHKAGERAVINNGYLRITVSTFTGIGGALANHGYARITNSTFARNVSSDAGGAIANTQAGRLLVEDSTFSANESSTRGGAIANAGLLTIANSTFSDNAAPAGAALVNSGTATVTNTIVMDGTGKPCSGSLSGRSTGNLVDRRGLGACGPSFEGRDDLRLGPLADNGGATKTHAPLRGSPAIDGGSNDVCTGADQRGRVRPQTRANPCDVGAVELRKIAVDVTNQPPVAVDHAQTVQAGSTPVRIDLASVVSDQETQDGALVYELTRPEPVFGTATLEGSAVTYAAYAGSAGTDSFGYRVTDGGGRGCGSSVACLASRSATATITITITALPPPPPPPIDDSGGTHDDRERRLPSPVPIPSPTPSPSPTSTALAAGPDLAVEDVRLELVSPASAQGNTYPVGTGVVAAAGDGAAGELLRLRARIVNYGDEPSAPTTLAVATSGWTGEDVLVDGVPSGSTLEVDETMPAPPEVTSDTKFLVTVREVDGESDATNNARPNVVAISLEDVSSTTIVVALVALLIVAGAAFVLGNLLRTGSLATDSSRRRRRGAPRQTVGLPELADRYLGGDPGPPLWAAGAGSEKLRAALADDDLFNPLISTVFWRALLATESFKQTLERAGASPAALETGEALVVTHAAGTRHDLVLLDPAFSLPEPASAVVDVSPDDLSDAWREVLATSPLRRGARVPGTKVLMNGLSEALKEVCRATKFGVVVTAKPEMVLTNCPSPAWPVGAEDEEPTSSVGVVAVDSDGRTGVTVADHAVRGREKVMVDGRLGTVLSSDPISDSSFVEVDVDGMDSSRGDKGPLSGMSPRQMEIAEFDGLRSGKTTTRVVGWDPTILTMESYIQTKIVTEPVTMPGDSGAALIDGEGHILGFAFYTTGLNSQPAHSGWIWAESVYRAHGLRPRGES